MSNLVNQFNEEFKHTKKLKAYTVQLTERDMQYVANGLAAFFNVMAREKRTVNPEQVAVLLNVMHKFKTATDSNNYKIVEEL